MYLRNTIFACTSYWFDLHSSIISRFPPPIPCTFLSLLIFLSVRGEKVFSRDWILLPAAVSLWFVILTPESTRHRPTSHSAHGFARGTSVPRFTASELFWKTSVRGSCGAAVSFDGREMKLDQARALLGPAWAPRNEKIKGQSSLHRHPYLAQRPEWNCYSRFRGRQLLRDRRCHSSVVCCRPPLIAALSVSRSRWPHPIYLLARPESSSIGEDTFVNLLLFTRFVPLVADYRFLTVFL